jgi:DNA-directed RNA polymerase subunit RPC12/RpoP
MGNARFETTACYARHGADAMIRCMECEHTTRASPTDLAIMFPIPARLSIAMKRLRCSHCGSKGSVKIAPVPQRPDA